MNATVSCATGLLLALAHATVGDWLGVDIVPWLRAFGVGLIGHGAALAWCSARSDADRWTRRNLLVIGPYPLLLLGLVAAGLVERGLGRGLVLADGVLVGAMALSQWSGLHRAGETAPEREPHRQPRPA